MRLFLCAALSALIGVTTAAQSPPRPDLPTVVDRAAAYASRFQQQFGTVVSEERYEQASRPALGSSRGAAAPIGTVLRSDFLLVQTDPGVWLPFRDVFERDGQPVRDRQDRLAKLFLSGTTSDAIARARDLANESSRYNIGNGTRTINVPTLPLLFLAADIRAGVVFSDGKRDPAVAARVIDFKEVGRPSLIKTTGDRDLPATGRLWVDEETGTLLRGRVHVQNTSLESEVDVTFARDDALGLWVPARMDERFRRGQDAVEIRGSATYTNFRRFQVTTSETLPDDLQGK